MAKRTEPTGELKAAAPADPAPTNEIAQLKEMVAAVIAKNSDLEKENIALNAQMKSIQTGGSPDLAEQERQRKIVAEASQMSYDKSGRDHAVILRIAPKGVKGNDRKQVVYKKKIGPFRTAQKPVCIKGSKEVENRSKSMIVADYNATIGARLDPEDVILEVA